jgi:Leucine-rich repeat (LRR) protein
MSESRLIYPATREWPAAVDDLSKVEKTTTRIRLISGAKGFEKLSEFTQLEALWCFGVDQKKLRYISECSSLKELHLGYNIRAADINCLVQLSHLRVLTLDSCSKIQSLEQVAALKTLVALAIVNFKNVHHLDPLANLTNLRELAIDGSIWTRMTLQTLAPLRPLEQLEYLSLSNTKVHDESLEPIGNLTNLRKLDIANFYPFQEFARLSMKLRQTECQWFAPFITMRLTCTKCQSSERVMLTGKGRPMLCQRCDAERLVRFVKEFEEVRNQA